MGGRVTRNAVIRSKKIIVNMIKTIIIAFSLPMIILCQTKVVTVRGKVVDIDSSNYDMIGANVFLINIQFADSVAHNKNFRIKNCDVYGNVVQKNGRYEIKNIPFGKYIIKCSFIGYKTITDTVVLDKNHLTLIKDFYLKAHPIKGGSIIE
jgi:hypothetical protein